MKVFLINCALRTEKQLHHLAPAEISQFEHTSVRTFRGKLRSSLRSCVAQKKIHYLGRFPVDREKLSFLSHRA